MTRPSGRQPDRGRARTRTQRRVIRVLTEGRVTEPDYLSRWGHHNAYVRLELMDNGMSPDALVTRAREYMRAQPRRRDDRDFDEIWCVFDTDNHKHLSKAIAEAGHSGIEVAVSNPCFELWLVLHVNDHTASIDRRAAQRLSKELGLSAGKRIAAGAENTLIDGFQDAKRRAQALDQRHAGNNSPPRSNPSTGVWRLVDKLR